MDQPKAQTRECHRLPWTRLAFLSLLSLATACDQKTTADCCPIDYYLCNGGRTGGARPDGGVCPGSFDIYYSPRVLTTDRQGCEMIDQTKSTVVSCLADAATDAPADVGTGTDGDTCD